MLPYLTASFNRLCAALSWQQPDRPPDPACDAPCPLAHPTAPRPAWVLADPVVQKYRALLGHLPWHQFPERPTDRAWPGPQPQPRAPFVAAYLIQLHEGKRYMSELRTYLIEHPALVYWLGFPRSPDPAAPVRLRRGCDRSQAAAPQHRVAHLAQCGLPVSAACHHYLPPCRLTRRAAGHDTIAGDTQALLAWVRENNPKQFVKEGRLDKTRQPRADPDCKLGVKQRRNPAPPDDTADHPAPRTDAQPATQLQVGVDILWGYASGIVVTRLPGGTEVVLAERTRPFNESEPSYFYPLMQQVEARLGRRPRFGTGDAAFDAHYVYDYFHQAGGVAAVPLNPGKRGAGRQFAPDGAPLCAAGLAMAQRFTYMDRTSTLVPHERAKYGCPLLVPQPTGATCPMSDPHWMKGGCTTTLATSAGARIRHQLDRASPAYRDLYAQRTMVERINSQAEALGILHPKLRQGQAIVNRNTLVYVLINLRALARLRQTRAEAAPTPAALTLAA